MACATGISVAEWRTEYERDERVISTAVEVMRDANRSASDPGAGGSQRKTLLSSDQLTGGVDGGQDQSEH